MPHPLHQAGSRLLPLGLMLDEKWPFSNSWLVQELVFSGCFPHLPSNYLEKMLSGPLNSS